MLPAAALAGEESGQWRCEAGNGTLSSLGKLTRCREGSRRRKVWTTPLLSLLLALSLLLVVAGDVETNPGPVSGED